LPYRVIGSFLITPAQSEAQPRSVPSVFTPIIFNACSHRSLTESSAKASVAISREHVAAAASIAWAHPCILLFTVLLVP
jgi:hypothetical protein